MMNEDKQRRSKKRIIKLWLDKDLVEIIKNADPKFDLNEELKVFFYEIYCNTNTVTEITLDSWPQMKNFKLFIYNFSNQLTQLFKTINSLQGLIVDISINVLYNQGYESDDNGQITECDQLSSYYSIFHNRPEEINRIKQNDEKLCFLKNKFFTKQIEQIKCIYNLNNRDLDYYESPKKLIEFLLSRIENNRDIIHLLNYKKFYNKHRKKYRVEHIAQKRYLKKNNR